MSKFVISDTLDAAVNARSVINFKVSMLSEVESSTGKDLINFKTVCRSQMREYLGRGGRWLNTFDTSAQTRGGVYLQMFCLFTMKCRGS